MTYKIIKNKEDLYELENEWDELVERIENPQIFYKFAWTQTYMEHYDKTINRDLCIVITYDDEKLIAIFPFVCQNKTIKFLIKETADYNLIYVDNSYNRYVVIKNSMEFLLENVMVKRFFLTNVPGSSELYILEDVLKKMGFYAFVKENIIAPSLKNGLNTKKVQKRHDKKRKEKKLRKEHDIEIVTTNILKEEALSFIAECKAKKYADNRLMDRHVMDFYLNLSSAISENIYVNILYVDGNVGGYILDL